MLIELQFLSIFKQGVSSLPHYYVSNPNRLDGIHFLHRVSCINLSPLEDFLSIGFFWNNADALEEAQKQFLHVVRCLDCCNESYIRRMESIANK